MLASRRSAAADRGTGANPGTLSRPGPRPSRIITALMQTDLMNRPVRRLLVVCPTWLGDTIMATPTLRALRGLYPQGHITVLIRHAHRAILEACPWVDRFVTIRTRRKGIPDARRRGPFNLARRLAAGRFDAAVVLPNSFRAAAMVRMAGIPRRIGYDRDGRGGLLTDRLLPRRQMGKFIPVPTHEYYLGVARYLGAVDPDPTLQLFTRPEDDQRARGLLGRAGIDLGALHREARPFILISPGANYGEAKLWMPQRFAQVADRCVQDLGATVALSGSPKERPILDQVLGAAHSSLVDLPSLGVDLGALKCIFKEASLLVTNDSGARHIAAAFRVPVVTIFGPTDPAWTDISYGRERQVWADVFCRPCQKKKCPLRGTADDHICMRRIDAQMVYEHVTQLLSAAPDRVGASA